MGAGYLGEQNILCQFFFSLGDVGTCLGSQETDSQVGGISRHSEKGTLLGENIELQLANITF